MKQVERVFVSHLNLVLYFLFRLVLSFSWPKGRISLLQFAVCLSGFTEMPSHFDLAGPPEALAHLRSPAQHWSPAGICAPGAVPGREGVGGKSASPFTTFSTQHGRHTLDYGTSPRIELVLNAWGWVPLIGTFWGTCKWIFFIRVGTVTSQCLLHCF